jgi:dTDP-4-dehydrorhamnose 3,5-epimerase
VLSETAEVLYKCDVLYHKPSELGILYADPALQINWGVPVNQAIVSDKDKILPCLAEFDSPFEYGAY